MTVMDGLELLMYGILSIAGQTSLCFVRDRDNIFKKVNELLSGSSIVYVSFLLTQTTNNINGGDGDK